MVRIRKLVIPLDKFKGLALREGLKVSQKKKG